MPKQRTVLTIFVATPGDVSSERAILEDVVRELNTTWGSTLGVQLDLVSWLTHARPGMGIDAQDVINQQITDDYDIFVGVMWTRFGTPTGRAGSGTEEEFNRALGRYHANPDSVKVMFYFKDEALPPSSLDLRQYEKIVEFKRHLGAEGALYWNFTADFESFLRLHLAREIQAWLSTQSSNNSGPSENLTVVGSTPAITSSVVEAEEERGLLDYAEAFSSHFAQLHDSQARLIAHLDHLNERIHERTDEQNKANAEHPGDFAVMKRIANGLAGDMQQFVTRVEAELPVFGSEMQETMQSFSMALTLAGDFGPGALGDMTELRSNVEKMAASLYGSMESTISFQQTIAGSPRLTTEYNRAKRSAVALLDRLTDEMRTGYSLLQQVLRAIDGLELPA